MTDSLTYQLTRMPREQANLLLGGDTALLKVQATRTFELCAREAAQIFGGNSYVRGGRGEKIERLYREVRAYAIPGVCAASPVARARCCAQDASPDSMFFFLWHDGRRQRGDHV